MSTFSVKNTNLKRLAQQLEDDIRRRGLRAGDRYLTAAEARKQFDASEISIHRAMQLLADRDYLVRQRGAGTFVGSRIKPPQIENCPLHVVHVVMSMDYQRTATLPAEVLVEQLGAAMPDAVVEVHYVPDYDSLRHLERIVERIAEEDKSTEGVILIRSSRPMQLYMERSHLPAVVFGGVYPGVTKLPWVDVDQQEIGRLMARHVLDAGHKRIALLMRDDWRHGDNLMFAGITQELGAAGLGLDALAVCSVPPETEHVAEEVRGILSRDDAPTAVMCRTHLYAEGAQKAIRGLKRRKSNVLLVAGGGRKPTSIRYAYASPDITVDEQVQTLGRMLLDRATQEKTQIQHRVIPVHLCQPK